jgi:hypothetical protein
MRAAGPIESATARLAGAADGAGAPRVEPTASASLLPALSSSRPVSVGFAASGFASTLATGAGR